MWMCVLALAPKRNHYMCVHACECVLSAAQVCDLELIVLLGHAIFFL